MNSYKIIFAGTPEFSVKTLEALVHSQHTVTAVYTQPDRPAGRGRKLTPSPVKQVALQQGLPVYQPNTLRDVNEQKILADLSADLMIVVAYGLVLPQVVLQTPKLGCINVHASLLPRWRGAAPIQRAILAGDAETGVTIMQMDTGLDTGAMLYKKSCPILAEDTSATLHDRLALIGAEALLTTLENLSSITPQLQNNTDAIYAKKMTKEEAKLDWSQSAVELERKVRAFNPWPVAFIQRGEEMLRVWQATVTPSAKLHSTPGTILQVSTAGIDVATSEGALRLEKIQFPGGRVLSVANILNSRAADFSVGSQL